MASISVAFLLFLSACFPTETGGLSGASPTATATATGLTLRSPSPTAYTFPACCDVAMPTPLTGPPVVISDVCSLADRSAVEAIIATLRTQPTNWGGEVEVDPEEGPTQRLWPIDLPLPGFAGSGCAYRSNDGALDVTFGARAIGRTEFETGVRLIPGATAVSGAGDEAYSIRVDVPFRAAGAASIVVLDGSTYFTVEARSLTKSSDALLSSIIDLAKRIADRV